MCFYSYVSSFGFIEFLEFVKLCILPNSGNFQPDSFRIVLCLIFFSINNFNYMCARELIIGQQAIESLFTFPVIIFPLCTSVLKISSALIHCMKHFLLWYLICSQTQPMIFCPPNSVFYLKKVHVLILLIGFILSPNYVYIFF